MTLRTLEKQTKQIEKEQELAAVSIVIKNADIQQLKDIEELIQKRKEELKNGIN